MRASGWDHSAGAQSTNDIHDIEFDSVSRGVVVVIEQVMGDLMELGARVLDLVLLH